MRESVFSLVSSHCSERARATPTTAKVPMSKGEDTGATNAIRDKCRPCVCVRTFVACVCQNIVSSNNGVFLRSFDVRVYLYNVHVSTVFSRPSSRRNAINPVANRATFHHKIVNTHQEKLHTRLAHAHKAASHKASWKKATTLKKINLLQLHPI